MRILAALVAVCVVASFVGASDPSPKFFTPPQEARIKLIEDRLAALEAKTVTPAPATTSKLPSWTAITYADLHARVSKGERVTVAHGIAGPIGVPVVDSIPNAAPGVYECYPSDAGPMILRVSALATAAVPQAVPVFPTPVRSGIYNLTGYPFGGCAGGQCLPTRR